MNEGDKMVCAIGFVAASCFFGGYTIGTRERADTQTPADWHVYSKSGVFLPCTAPGVICYPARAKLTSDGMEFTTGPDQLRAPVLADKTVGTHP